MAGFSNKMSVVKLVSKVGFETSFFGKVFLLILESEFVEVRAIRLGLNSVIAS